MKALIKALKAQSALGWTYMILLIIMIVCSFSAPFFIHNNRLTYSLIAIVLISSGIISILHLRYNPSRFFKDGELMKGREENGH